MRVVLFINITDSIIQSLNIDKKRVMDIIPIELVT